MKKSNYNAENIKVLKGLETVRKHPTVYIGSITSQGIFHILKEAVDNSIDEYLNGHNDYIYCEYDPDTTLITVADKGRGIPVDIHKDTKLPAVTTVLVTLHAGSKMEGFKNEGEVSSGIHGVGISCTNAVSSNLQVWVKRNKKWYTQEFKKGKPVLKLKKTKDLPLEGHQCGTIIQFVPDKEIFGKYKLNISEVHSWFSKIQYLLPGLNLVIKEKGKKEVLYKTEQGLKDFVVKEVKEKKASPLFEDKENPDGIAFSFKNKNIDVSVLFTDYDEEVCYGYTNSITNKDGGTHVKGLQSVFNKLLKPLIDPSKKIVTEDLRLGFFSAIHIKLSNPRYSGQTKDRLVTEEATKIIKETLEKPLQTFFKKYPEIVDTLIARAVEFKKIRDSSKKEKEAMKKIKIDRKNAKGILPGKLSIAINCKPEDRELYIVEGDSAGGSADGARDSSFQEVLPLRGKIKNASKNSLISLVESEQVKNLIQAIGCDLSMVDPKKARVGKIIILCDADEDGKHIASLVLSFITHYIPELIKAGMVFIAKTPLFKASCKGKSYFGDTQEEVRNKFSDGAKPIISRFKGLGELNPEELREASFTDKAKENWIQIEMDENQNELVKNYMGEDVSYRKEMLQLN